ncbi:MAG: hypothetical protein ACP5KW_01635 [Thermoproteota archaeon]
MNQKILKKPRRLVVLSDSETSWDYGYNPNQRPINELLSTGCVVLDKHRGPTSHEVTSDLKKILNLRKAGHTGTLEIKGDIPMCPVFL